jgi:macrophage erythroblast attacher
LLIELHPELAPLLDSHLYSRLRVIEQAMLEHHSLVEALTWATDNKAFLKRIGSKLEFALRTQEYIEIARSRNYSECLKYAKGTLSCFVEGESMHELMPVAGLLAIAPDTLLDKYQELYADSRWSMLTEMFRGDFFAFYGLPKESPLLLILQAGLAVLKTPSCNEKSLPSKQQTSCPVCSGPFADISSALPISHRNNSRIVCQVTGMAIDENNPPIIFPNGHVYSAKGVAKVAGGAQGKFVCPRTGKVFDVSEGRKCFLTS